MLLRPVLRSVALQIVYINSFLPWILHFLSLFRHIGIDLPVSQTKRYRCLINNGTKIFDSMFKISSILGEAKLNFDFEIKIVKIR